MPCPVPDAAQRRAPSPVAEDPSGAGLRRAAPLRPKLRRLSAGANSYDYDLEVGEGAAWGGPMQIIWSRARAGKDLEDPPLPFDSACSRCEVREDRDLVAIAPTGSGKTLAYLLPLLADGLCKALCPPAVGLDAIFRRFQGLYPRSFEAGRGSNDTIMERLSKAFAARKTAEVTKVIKQVAKKAAEGDKDKALREKWSKLLEDLDAEGRLRPSGLVLAPSRELAQQVGQVARDLGCAAKVILGGVDHERQREQLKNERPSLLAVELKWNRLYLQ
ncbi:Hypothetical protein (Fragment) [Durusdinium trenchii]|uniref:RNA helicase n=1 Tax=Durusdinium trenchii TaxID=1381693 RepID=A0ABP0K5C2_9DINO